jgi:hypothetical protein
MVSDSQKLSRLGLWALELACRVVRTRFAVGFVSMGIICMAFKETCIPSR